MDELLPSPPLLRPAVGVGAGGRPGRETEADADSVAHDMSSLMMTHGRATVNDACDLRGETGEMHAPPGVGEGLRIPVLV